MKGCAVIKQLMLLFVLLSASAAWGSEKNTERKVPGLSQNEMNVAKCCASIENLKTLIHDEYEQCCFFAKEPTVSKKGHQRHFDRRENYKLNLRYQQMLLEHIAPERVQAYFFEELEEQKTNNSR